MDKKRKKNRTVDERNRISLNGFAEYPSYEISELEDGKLLLTPITTVYAIREQQMRALEASGALKR